MTFPASAGICPHLLGMILVVAPFLTPVAVQTQETTPADALAPSPMIIEIRIYYIRDGMRDEFVEFFETTIPEQAAVGMTVLGHFTGLANIRPEGATPQDDNYFVWIRGFPSERARAESTERFYKGPVWRERFAEDAHRMLVDDKSYVWVVTPTATSKINLATLGSDGGGPGT